MKIPNVPRGDYASFQRLLFSLNRALNFLLVLAVARVSRFKIISSNRLVCVLCVFFTNCCFATLYRQIVQINRVVFNLLTGKDELIRHWVPNLLYMIISSFIDQFLIL